jgi:hypothetical protein
MCFFSAAIGLRGNYYDGYNRGFVNASIPTGNFTWTGLLSLN